jgi:hypothetical protein
VDPTGTHHPPGEYGDEISVAELYSLPLALATAYTLA